MNLSFIIVFTYTRTSCRFDCPCVYELKVCILKSDKKTILDKIIKERKVTRETLHEECRKWVQVTITHYVIIRVIFYNIGYYNWNHDCWF